MIGSVLVTLLRVPSLEASTREYSLEIPDRREAAYEVAFEVEHPGRLTLAASWPSGRVLSFRLEGPGRPPLLFKRSGPSPQRIQVDVLEDTVAASRNWKLFIRALPDRGGVRASVSLDLPDPAQPGSSAAVPAEPPQTDTPAPAPEPWKLVRTAPRGAAGDVARVFDAVERFRSSIVSTSGEFLPDPCSWQSLFLRRAASLRDDLATGTASLDEGSSRCFERLAKAVAHVEELRVAPDPVIAGPIPKDPAARLEWRSRRNDRIRPLERDLDDLQQATRDGRCSRPDEDWLPRFVACMTACERYFEERGRVGEDDAVNRDLARSQWDRISAAAAVMRAISTPREPAPATTDPVEKPVPPTGDVP